MADQLTQPTKSPQEKSQRYAYLDVVRGLAALAVVVTHIFETGIPGFRTVASQTCNLGLLGVLLFFIVSGTVITASIERTPSITMFWLQRFWRLYPAYWASLIISAALFLLVPSELNYPIYGHLKERFWASFAANATMLQSAIGYDHFIPPYWTLGFELAFYFALSVFALLSFGKRAHHLLWILSAFLLLASVYGLYKGGHVGTLKGILCGYFWMGIWVHRMLNGDESPKRFWTSLAVFQVSVVATWYTNFARYPAATPEAYTEFTFAPVAMLTAFLGATAIFVCLLQMRQRTFPRVFIGLGTVSYSLYLFHPLAMRVSGIGFGSHFSPIPFTVLSIVLTALFTWLAYRFVEVPSLRKVKAVKLAAS